MSSWADCEKYGVSFEQPLNKAEKPMSDKKIDRSDPTTSSSDDFDGVAVATQICPGWYPIRNAAGLLQAVVHVIEDGDGTDYIETWRLGDNYVPAYTNGGVRKLQSVGRSTIPWQNIQEIGQLTTPVTTTTHGSVFSPNDPNTLLAIHSTITFAFFQVFMDDKLFAICAISSSIEGWWTKSTLDWPRAEDQTEHVQKFVSISDTQAQALFQAWGNPPGRVHTIT